MKEFVLYILYSIFSELLFFILITLLSILGILFYFFMIHLLKKYFMILDDEFIFILILMNIFWENANSLIPFCSIPISPIPISPTSQIPFYFAKNNLNL